MGISALQGTRPSSRPSWPGYGYTLKSHPALAYPGSGPWSRNLLETPILLNCSSGVWVPFTVLQPHPTQKASALAARLQSMCDLQSILHV